MSRSLLALVAALVPTAFACQAPPAIPRDRDPENAERFEWSAPTGRVSGLRAGDPHGHRVVFVHGTPGFAASWSRYLEVPPDGVEFVSLDRPGFGQSEPKTAVPSLVEQAAAIEPLLVERDGRWPILVGHSLGGPVVLRVASDYPGRVGGVVVLAGEIDPALEELRWYNWVGRAIGWILPRAFQNSNAELFAHRSELEELVPRLERIRVPVTIVHGTEDWFVPYENARFLGASLPDAAPTRLVTLEGAGHMFVFGSPEIALEAVAEQLARYERRF